MISLDQVSKIFGSDVVIDNISMHIAEGEHMVLLGASGSGKTTVLRMINRLIEPTQGAISIEGRNIRTRTSHLLRRDIGYVLQANSLFPHYTVEENIAVIPNLLKWDRLKIRNRVAELLEKMHFPDNYRVRYPHQLSGGEGQRVNLARAMAANPPVLLMDEPFSALDTITRSSIRQLFKNLQDLKSKTIIIVTHDVQEAFEMGTTVALMQKGKIMQKGKPVDLLYRPANQYVRSFLSGNYLSLALTETSIEQLWQWLEDTGRNESEYYPTFYSSLTISKVMNGIGDKNKYDGTIKLIRDNSETKYTTWHGLIKAFAAFQKCRNQ